MRFRCAVIQKNEPEDKHVIWVKPCYQIGIYDVKIYSAEAWVSIFRGTIDTIKKYIEEQLESLEITYIDNYENGYTLGNVQFNGRSFNLHFPQLDQMGTSKATGYQSEYDALYYDLLGYISEPSNASGSNPKFERKEIYTPKITIQGDGTVDNSNPYISYYKSAIFKKSKEQPFYIKSPVPLVNDIEITHSYSEDIPDGTYNLGLIKFDSKYGSDKILSKVYNFVNLFAINKYDNSIFMNIPESMSLILKKNDSTVKSYGLNFPVLSKTDTIAVKSDLDSINPYITQKVCDFTYKMHYCNLDYDYANKYFEVTEVEAPKACSSVKNGNYYGRNYDWIYNNSAEFIIETSNTLGKYATIGIGGFSTALTAAFVESKQYSEEYKIIPFKIVDGINEKGVVCNINVVPLMANRTATQGEIQTKETICNMMLPRYILDNFATAKEAADYIRDYVSVTNFKTLGDKFHYDLHVMIGDKDNVYVIEFIDGKNKVIDLTDSKAIMTNFHLYGVEFNEDGSVCTPEEHWEDETKDPATVNNIEEYGTGLERYNIANSQYDLANTEAKMFILMQSLKFTNTYTLESNKWYTECVGEYETYGKITISSDRTSIEEVHNKMIELYNDRSRDTGETWHTVHSSVFNIKEKSVKIKFQETDEVFEFTFNLSTKLPADVTVDTKTDSQTGKLDNALSSPSLFTETLHIKSDQVSYDSDNNILNINKDEYILPTSKITSNDDGTYTIKTGEEEAADLLSSSIDSIGGMIPYNPNHPLTTDVDAGIIMYSMNKTAIFETDDSINTIYAPIKGVYTRNISKPEFTRPYGYEIVSDPALIAIERGLNMMTIGGTGKLGGTVIILLRRIS